MNQLEKELKNLPDNFIVGIVMPADSYQDANMRLLNFFIKTKKASGGYVSINKPSISTIELLKNKNINADKLFFIDCISKGLGGAEPKLSNCVLIDSPSHLTDLSIELDKFFYSHSHKNRFIYIDSISTLCIHNDIGDVLKLLRTITGKMRLHGLNGVILSMHEGADRKLTSELGQFCDKVIHL